MADAKRNLSPMDRVWNFFISLKLAITVLILLAAASIIGTIVEQNQPLEKYREVYEDWVVRLFDTLKFFDMYHSWWFLLLMVLFTVNLACCTLDRLPRVIRIVRNPKTKLDDTLEKTLGFVVRWKKKGTPAEWVGKYTDAIAKAFGKAPQVVEEDGAVHLYADRGVVSRFGVYVTHLSIIIIFIGAIIGNVIGYKGFLGLVVGDTAQMVPVRGGSQLKDVGFGIRCDNFNVEYYKDPNGMPTGQPKEYASNLTVIENGREILQKKIVVNDPLRYKGVWFYQSSYGEDKTAARIVLKQANGTPMGTFHLLFMQGEAYGLPGLAVVRLMDFQENFQGQGPAIGISIEKPGQPPVEEWLPLKDPEADRRRGDSFYLTFAGMDQVNYTGLQVAHDPGVNVVWLGCALMVVGILIAFFMSHRRVWVRLSPAADGKVDVVVAGTTSRNRLTFEKEFERLQNDLKVVA